MDFKYAELTVQLDLPRITKLHVLREYFRELHLLNGEYKVQCYLGVFEYKASTEDTLEQFKDLGGLINLLYDLTPRIISPRPRLSAFKAYIEACKASSREEALYKHLQALGTRRREFSTIPQLVNEAQQNYHYKLPKSVLDCMYTEKITKLAIHELRCLVPDDAWSYNCDMKLWVKEGNAK